MAKAPASDSIMPTSKMKSLLALSKQEPVHAAIGLTADGDGVILLDKKAKPKKVFSMLKANAGKAKLQLNTASLRFGRAEVDPDYDAGTVRFFVNKDAPGTLRVKLTEVIKRIPFQKVEINVDPSLEEEPEEDATDESAASPPANAQLDAAALKQRLTALVQRMPQALQADPSRKDTLLTLAKQAQGQLATDLAAASDTIGQLEAAMQAPTGPQAARQPDAEPTKGAVSYAKARLAWSSARKQMEGDLEKLRQQLLEFYGETDILADINRNYTNRVEPILNQMDESLCDVLDDASNATDANKRAELVGQARALIGRYQAFMGSEPMFKELDGNPFVPLSISATMTKTLTALSAALR
jgi:hypothetical protein